MTKKYNREKAIKVTLEPGDVVIPGKYLEKLLNNSKGYKIVKGKDGCIDTICYMLANNLHANSGVVECDGYGLFEISSDDMYKMTGSYSPGMIIQIDSDELEQYKVQWEEK